jgi:4-hydroxybenzoate polyprenyltransferase
MNFASRGKMFLELVRFSHTIFALPFALLTGVLAWTTPSTDGTSVPFQWQHLAGILASMVTARSAAMAFNRLADARLDAANPRTATRHLPAGKLSWQSVTLFTLLCVAGFIASTLLFLPNTLPVILSVPVLCVLLGYSFTKRFTSLAHYWLGFSLMLAPLAVWVALRGEAILAHPSDLLPAAVLGSAVLFWVGGFDIIYATQDSEFDRSTGLHSIPAKCGVVGALRIAVTSHAVTILMLVILPWSFSLAGLQHRLGFIWYGAVAAVAGLLWFEHRLVRPDDLTRVNAAFFNVNAIISFGLFAAAAVDSFTG